jgi:hypothetical protein
MINYPFKELEAALVARSPRMAQRLQPGLPEARVRKRLQRAKVGGAIEPIVQLYCWKNGTNLGWDLDRDEDRFFPGQVAYYFTELERAVNDCGFFKEAVVNHPRISEAVDRYFPAFWNGSSNWFGIDLGDSIHSRVVIIEFDSDQPFREAYRSFEDFINDLIRANREKIELRCLKSE